jgi:hypothetical protein
VGCSVSWALLSLATLSWTTFFSDDSLDVLLLGILLVLTRSCSAVSEDIPVSDGLGVWSVMFRFSMLLAMLTAQLRGPGIIEPESSRPLGSILLLARLEHSWLKLTLGCLPLSMSVRKKDIYDREFSSSNKYIWWRFFSMFVLCTQVNTMFVMLLWVYIHTGRA